VPEVLGRGRAIDYDDGMEFSIPDAMEVLERTPGCLRAMLGGLGEGWIQSNYGENTFSPFDVVGHLIHGERTDWMVRARIILESGPSRPFDPFDRYAMHEAGRGQSIGRLLDTFETLRTANLRDLKAMNLGPDELSRCGTHPALGRVTLAQLLATWVVHDLGHLHQIAKCMAHQYRDHVGPWRAYLSILPPA
jgi:hypothetical protein